VAEHVTFGETVYDTPGVGALIAEATAQGNYPMLAAATLALVLVVVLINRFLWLRLYRRAEERYRME
jgi:NitT/TauT family transport system permease protein